MITNIGMFLFNDVQLLDFAGPYEVFSDAASISDGLASVFTVTENGMSVKSKNGLTVVPDYGFSDHPPIDILVVPGGQGTKAEICKDTVLEWVRNNSQKAGLTMSVCTGARILGKIGLLDGKEAVTHHGSVEDISRLAPEAIFRKDKRFIRSGRILTAGGISAGIDAALYVVGTYFGEDVARKTKIRMEYGDWNKEQTKPG